MTDKSRHFFTGVALLALVVVLFCVFPTAMSINFSIGFLVAIGAVAWDASHHKLKVKRLFPGLFAVWFAGALFIGLPLYGTYSVIASIASPAKSQADIDKEDQETLQFQTSGQCLGVGAKWADVFLASGATADMSADFKNKACAKSSNECEFKDCADGYSLEIKKVLNGGKSYLQEMHDNEMEGR
jgi:hypothetical protein